MGIHREIEAADGEGGKTVSSASQSKKSVLYITQTFPPEPGSTARPLHLSLGLQRAGYEITILTAMPSYPLGKIFEGYRRKIFKKENVEGVNVLRVWAFPAKNRGRAARLLGFLSFAFTAVLFGLLQKKHDLLIASVPHMGTELAGLVVGKVKRCITALELRDIIPDNLTFLGIPEGSFVSASLGRYFGYVQGKMDLIIVPGESMKRNLIGKGVDENKIIVLPHGADPDGTAGPVSGDDGKAPFDPAGKFIVMYSGSFSPYYDLLNCLQAAALLDGKELPVRFVLIGQGPDRENVRRLIHRLNIGNVILAGPVDPRSIAAFHRLADVFIAPYVSSAPTPGYMRDYLTTKVAEYLMAGKPVIAVEDGKIAGNIIKANDLGAVVAPQRPDLLAGAVERYANDRELVKRQGLAARAYALENLDRKKLVERFDRELQERCLFLKNREKV